MNRTFVGRGVIAAMGLAIGLSSVALAQDSSVPLAKVDQGWNVQSIGPTSAFGESAQETAEKRVVFAWTALLMGGHPKEAFEKYVSKDFFDHSHLVMRLCKCKRPGYQQALASFLPHGGQGGPPNAKAGGPPAADISGFPTEATVDGDMVTMYHPGVDIFRVKDGKITDHWDASPAAAIDLEAEKPFPANL